MIISFLNGGLGNQMFQYACGRSLADRLGVEFALDLRHFDGNAQYEFTLDRFNLRHRPIETTKLPPDRHKAPMRYLLWRGLRLSPQLLREAGLGYNAAIETATDGPYLKGYWQSERYFADNADNIRSDFTLIDPPDPANSKALDAIASTAAVSLHIRRGDYVSDAATNATHGVCSMDYYQHAARHIAEATGEDPLIFAFSDDPDWVRDNLILPFEMRFIDHNDGVRGYEDLRLMAACRHHIVANSSFSWWGAWLNPSPDKIVVAPEKWFANPKIHNPDIVPEAWVKV